MMLGGLQVIVSPLLTIDGPPVEVARTWKERWLTRPWRPWVKTRTVITQIPDPNGYMMEGKVVMHPHTLHLLHQALEARSPYSKVFPV